MNYLDNYLDIKRELLQAQLRVVYRHQRKGVPQGQKLKRTSNLTIVEDILQNSGQPLHISKIIQIAKKDYGVNLERDSVVSAVIKKINAGKIFVRVAPNTFALKNSPEMVDEGGAL
ncbi:MAG: HTH domain-containing protein [Deltaproteobacteria bacterium]|nr:HTH domain-containing protein [Deltaproteobacteria bacterium]MDZ7696324.1 HTH domain-containing protein [Deltaproteobacteria bacterium]MDZ7696402.1 HTH domain-containing protein [Deltaproteobacteria bacterium]MDZ7696752.1 HTH domain-containing protein [Deltaproteobacteria bacterium]MDZ7698930.1 HTH domain-containing protein [Deltaproteobacteria bacterium]